MNNISVTYQKLLGIFDGERIKPAEITASAHCNRVPVRNGHLEAISVEFENKPTKEQIIEIWKNFKGIPQELNLPMAPKQPIIYEDEADHPQTRYDRDNDKGMAVTCGRLRECNILDYRFVGLSNNIVRGAAGGGILNAELLKSKGYLK